VSRRKRNQNLSNITKYQESINQVSSIKNLSIKYQVSRIYQSGIKCQDGIEIRIYQTSPSIKNLLIRYQVSSIKNLSIKYQVSRIYQSGIKYQESITEKKSESIKYHQVSRIYQSGIKYQESINQVSSIKNYQSIHQVSRIYQLCHQNLIRIYQYH